MSESCHSGADAAAYALGALDDHELPAFQRHLVSCTICQEEVFSLQHLTNVLPLSASQYPVSKALRKRVIGEVRDDALARVQAAPRAQRRRSLDFLIPEGGIFAGGGGRPRPGLIGLATAVALVLVVVVVGLTAGGGKSTTGSNSHVYQASVGKAEVVLTNGRAQLIVHGMTELNKSSTYEVWFERKGDSQPEPKATFNTSASGSDAVSLPSDLQGVTKVLVTKEKAPGALKPTTNPVVVATLS